MTTDIEENASMFKKDHQFVNEPSDYEDDLVDDEQEALDFPTTEAPHDCQIGYSEVIKITKWLATSNLERFVKSTESDKVQRGGVEEIMSYLEGKDKIGYEEVHASGGDQHLRLMIDLDLKKDDYINDPLYIHDFIHAFAEFLLSALDDEHKGVQELKVYNKITVEQIVQGAAIAVKYERFDSGVIKGVHIYFTNIITHLASFSHLSSIMKNAIAWGNTMKKSTQYGLHKSDYKLFNNIDLGLYKSNPRLRTIYAIKGDPAKPNDKRFYEPLKFDVEKNEDIQNKEHHHYKASGEKTTYNYSDYFFTFIPEQLDEYDCLHFEIKMKEHKESKQSSSTGTKEEFVGEELID